jgi:hypothetical protein
MSAIYIHNEDKCTNNQLFRWKKRWYWYGPKSASLDRLLIKVTWTVFQLHSWRQTVSNNTSPRQFLHMSTCGLYIGVTARCFLTSKKCNILNSRATHLGPVRRASCVFDSPNTTSRLLFRKWFYPLYLLGTPQDIFCLLFSAMFVSFWIFPKVRKIIDYLPVHLKTCKVG